VADRFAVTARLKKGGIMELYRDGKEVASGKAGGLFKLPLRDAGLRLGNDYRKSGMDKAGNYPDSTREMGNISNARLETLLVEKEKEVLGKPDQVIVLKTIPHEMKFDQPKLTVKAGSIVEIVMTNVDFMQHNLLILSPGSMQSVGDAADKLAQTPEGAGMQYIPQVPDVLFSTPLVNPDAKFSLKFRVPDIPGDYPYICSYPGHWRIMNGVMTVVR
jgi:azurin